MDLPNLSGHYEPNAPGARTIREAKPLYVGDKRVTVQVANRTAYLFVGTTYGEPIELPEHVMNGGDVNRWAQETIANRPEETEHEYVVTGALITPDAYNPHHPFADIVKAKSHEDAFKIAYAQYEARLNPLGDGDGDVYNFWIQTTGDRWYGWGLGKHDDF
jgi:hypothetical protein